MVSAANINCSIRGSRTYEACYFDPSTKEKCIPNNKYGYVPEGFGCVLVPNTRLPECKLVCLKACGQQMHDLATDHSKGLSNAGLKKLQCKQY